MKSEIGNDAGQQGDYSIAVGKRFNHEEANLYNDVADKDGF